MTGCGTSLGAGSSLLAALDGVLLAVSVAEVLRAASVDGVLRAASVGRTLSPSAYVVVLLRSDFQGFYC